MKEIAIKKNNVSDINLFISKCKEMGFSLADKGSIDREDYLYFNIKGGNEQDLKEGQFWGAMIEHDTPTVKSVNELYNILTIFNPCGDLYEDQSPIDMVEEFHDAFGVKNNDNPTMIWDWDLRRELAQEELDEYEEACKNDDKIEILDSLVDQAYILFGTILRQGMADVFINAFAEVHESNMSKLDENGKPIINDGLLDSTKPAGKILKGTNFREPNLKQFIKS